MRFIFVSDESCNNYIIPEDQEALFNILHKEALNNDEWALFESKFNQYRCFYHTQRYSFLDPQLRPQNEEK